MIGRRPDTAPELQRELVAGREQDKFDAFVTTCRWTDRLVVYIPSVQHAGQTVWAGGEYYDRVAAENSALAEIDLRRWLRSRSTDPEYLAAVASKLGSSPWRTLED